jgi:haloalkane dehalogenase
MTRRDFLYGSTVAAGAAILPDTLANAKPAAIQPIDAKAFHASRKFADLPVSRVAYVERGRGLAALFIHGYPLNGFQWRGALERLQPYRRCIAPDVMGLGYTQTPEGQIISPETQADMLAMFLDSLHINEVDLVANDSGGLVAQLLIAKHPHRVRTLLLTNCDVDENNPPPQFAPFVESAKKGTLVEKFIVSQLNDKQLARSARGLGGAYTFPQSLADETIETYLRPLVETPLKKEQVNQYTVSLGTNALIAIREELHQWKGSARMVWGLKDPFFGVQWAEWLDHTLPDSHGVRRLDEANLFFPEEMPDIIAAEAMALWGISPLNKNHATSSTEL